MRSEIKMEQGLRAEESAHSNQSMLSAEIWDDASLQSFWVILFVLFKPVSGYNNVSSSPCEVRYVCSDCKSIGSEGLAGELTSLKMTLSGRDMHHLGLPHFARAGPQAVYEYRGVPPCPPVRMTRKVKWVQVPRRWIGTRYLILLQNLYYSLHQNSILCQHRCPSQ